jgi:hypothetical protein
MIRRATAIQALLCATMIGCGAAAPPRSIGSTS